MFWWCVSIFCFLSFFFFYFAWTKNDSSSIIWHEKLLYFDYFSTDFVNVIVVVFVCCCCTDYTLFLYELERARNITILKTRYSILNSELFVKRKYSWTAAICNVIPLCATVNKRLAGQYIAGKTRIIWNIECRGWQNGWIQNMIIKYGCPCLARAQRSIDSCLRWWSATNKLHLFHFALAADNIQHVHIHTHTQRTKLYGIYFNAWVS